MLAGIKSCNLPKPWRNYAGGALRQTVITYVPLPKEKGSE